MTKNCDPNAIPRPLNCFLIYRLEKQQEIVAKCAGANHRDISKIIAKWWKEASEEEKRPFREKARLAKLEHRKMYPGYKYAPRKKNTPRRVYIRRNKKEEFTSRYEENNKLMEMIYEDPNALNSIEPVSNPKPKPASANSKAKTQKKPKRTNDKVMPVYQVPSDLNHLDNYLGSQVQVNFPTTLSYLSPYTETYSEYNAPSPFCSSVNSFDMNQQVLATPPPLDFSYMNNFTGYESCNNTFNDFSAINHVDVPGYDMVYANSNMYYETDYFMSQKQSGFIDPSLLNTA